MRSVQKYRVALLAIPILLIDLVAFSNVFEALLYFERPLTAAAAAAAFAALNVGTLVLFSQDLSDGTRRWLFAGAALLFAVAGLANVGMAYIRSETALPAEALVRVLGFGGSEQALRVGAAWIFGLALVVAGLIFWTTFGTFIRKEREHQRQVQIELEEILRSR